VVAEGIETLEQTELLKSLDCEYGQGYYWGHPLPPWEVGQWLREFSVKD
jgi:EAL domain-containing protein (putative c-di-GMP-specific phosphodiesterase class I)